MTRTNDKDAASLFAFAESVKLSSLNQHQALI